MTISTKGKANGWVVALLALFLVLLLAPVASAQTSTTTATDNPDDLVKALGNQRYYVANSVKANPTFMQKNSTIESDLKNEVNQHKNVAIAIISSSSFPSQFSGTGTNAQTNLDNYTKFVSGFLTNPKPDVLLIVNAQQQNWTLIAPDLSQAERDKILADAKNVAATQNVTKGALTIADESVDKLSSNKSGSFVTTIIIIVLVIVVLAGVVAFLLINTKRQWQQKLVGLQSLANQVSDQVVRVSDNINFLPDEQRQRTDTDFGTATRSFSEANDNLRQLQGVSPVTLLLKGPDYQRKLNLAGSQFQQVQQSLTQVEQHIASLPPR